MVVTDRGKERKLNLSKLKKSRGWTFQCSCSAMRCIWNAATQAQVGDDLAKHVSNEYDEEHKQVSIIVAGCADMSREQGGISI